MASLNKVLLIGNLTADPQIRTIASGQSVASFSVATNRRWKDKNTGELKEESQFHNIVAWGRLAEICSQYVKKGMRIYVEGRLQTRSWDDQKTGQKRYTTEIIMESMIMLDRKGTTNLGAAGSYTQKQATPTPAQQSDVNIPAPEQIPTINIDDNQEEIKMEDIPF